MLLSVSSLGLAALGCAIFFALLRPLIIYFWDPKDLRRFPAASLWGIPAWAGWSNMWLTAVIAQQKRSDFVLAAHEKLGPIVRIQPDHISFSDTEAVKTIYGFASKMPKGEFYNTFSEPDAHGRVFKNLVTTDDKEEHARKRKMVSHAFSQKNILNLEPVLIRRMEHFVKCLDKFAEGSSATGELDLYRWINYFLYDTSSDLTFGQTMGLCDKGNDALDALPFDGTPVCQVDGIDAFQSSGLYANVFAPWPKIHLQLKKLTSWHSGAKKGKKYAQAVHLALQERLKRGETKEYKDFVSYLMEDSQHKARDLEYLELLGETFVIFASSIDLVASVATAAMFHLIKNPDCLRKLREELDANLGDTEVPKFEQLSHLPYMKAVFDETTRDRPPLTHGLPRIVPEGGATISGHFIQGGTTVSVSAFALHHNSSIFPEPWSFRPERFLGPDVDTTTKECHVPFSVGPRACTGRNLTNVLIPIVYATLVRHFDFELPSSDWEMEWREPLNMNPVALPVKIRRRQVKA